MLLPPLLLLKLPKDNSQSGPTKLHRLRLTPRLPLLPLRPRLLLKRQNSSLRWQLNRQLWRLNWHLRKPPLKHKLLLKKLFSLLPSKLEKNLLSNRLLNMNLRCKKDNLSSRINSETFGLLAQLVSLWSNTLLIHLNLQRHSSLDCSRKLSLLMCLSTNLTSIDPI